MSFNPALVIFPAAVLLAGCADSQIGMRDPAFGEAFKYDTAIQVINPDPVYPDQGAKPGDNGEHAAAAVERYRKGNVTPVEETQTTSGSGSGSGTGPR